MYFTMQAALTHHGSLGSDSETPPPFRKNTRRLKKSADDSEGISKDAEDGGEDEVDELERLRKEKLAYYYEIERYKKLVTYAIILALFMIFVAVIMVIWRFTSDKPTFWQMREKVLSTASEEPRLCVTIYPNVIDKEFDPEEVGEPLFLTSLIEAGKYKEAASKAKVESVLQSEKSYTGFLTVDMTYNSTLFFWYFPSFREENEDIPLVLWLQGGPGWPSMYGLFKENGPFLVGYDESSKASYLVPNKFSWNDDHHMLYIDNPVGSGFSFTDSPQGYPQTDEEVSVALMEALRQFMKVFPFMSRGAKG